jgi:uncharacterized membrane protein
MSTWKAYLLLLPIFAAIDLAYLGYLMRWFYDRELGELVRRSDGAIAPRWAAALFVYLLIPAGMMLFVRPQLSPADPVWRALLWGAAYGFVVYGVYDFTNRATLDAYSLRLALADVAWGTVLCGGTAAILHAIAPPGR